jgi:hypothetical protein
MPLATSEQIQIELTNIINYHNENNTEQILIAFAETEFILRYRNKTILQDAPYFENAPWPGHNTLHNEDKYHQITGKTPKDLSKNLFYHWITNFKHLKTYEQLKTAIQEPETCGSIATAIALNKYLKDNPISDLLKGSKFRWVITHKEDYIQQTLYNTYTTVYNKIDFIYNNENYFPLNTLTSIIPFYLWLSKEKHKIDQQIDNQPRQLLQHSAKATEKFNFKFDSKKKLTAKPLFLGIELELEGMSDKEYPNLDTLTNHAILKRDGSLNNGVEICSAPATIDIHKQEFEPFFNKLIEKKSKLKALPTCGMHIHIDRASLSTLHIANIYLLVNKLENRAQITTIAGRQPNQFCQAHVVGYHHFTSPEENTKYRMVNLRPEDTIELRIFASTTLYPVFCKYLEFAQALVDYTKPGFLNIPTPKLHIWENFQNYVKTQPKQYPTLAKEI